ncbi:hypothetical protein WJX72_008060 [[Myrmecia] bisecta]|uniref:Carbonic anhydrase n=1 Tax=[Myrmecia] bisecta TaxID=41462 RepID=A0AAW1PLY0_9CHLO
MPLIDELKASAEKWHKNFQPDKVVKTLFPMNKPLTVLCCMDHRVIPEKILGLGVGDAEVIRNGGGRVIKGLEPSFIITQDFCKSKLIIVIHHNDCGACHLGKDKDKVLEEYKKKGVDLSEVFANWSPITDVDESVREDVKKLRQLPMVRDDVTIYGFAYDVNTGALKQVVHDPSKSAPEP